MYTHKLARLAALLTSASLRQTWVVVAFKPQPFSRTLCNFLDLLTPRRLIYYLMVGTSTVTGVMGMPHDPCGDIACGLVTCFIAWLACFFFHFYPFVLEGGV
jgi:hypothetical protein